MDSTLLGLLGDAQREAVRFRSGDKFITGLRDKAYKLARAIVALVEQHPNPHCLIHVRGDRHYWLDPHDEELVMIFGQTLYDDKRWIDRHANSDELLLFVDEAPMLIAFLANEAVPA